MLILSACLFNALKSHLNTSILTLKHVASVSHSRDVFESLCLFDFVSCPIFHSTSTEVLKIVHIFLFPFFLEPLWTRTIISASECFEINVELFVPFNAVIIFFLLSSQHTREKILFDNCMWCWVEANVACFSCSSVECISAENVSLSCRWKRRFSDP